MLANNGIMSYRCRVHMACQSQSQGILQQADTGCAAGQTVLLLCKSSDFISTGRGWQSCCRAVQHHRQACSQQNTSIPSAACAACAQRDTQAAMPRPQVSEYTMQPAATSLQWLQAAWYIHRQRH